MSRRHHRDNESTNDPSHTNPVTRRLRPGPWGPRAAPLLCLLLSEGHHSCSQGQALPPACLMPRASGGAGDGTGVSFPRCLGRKQSRAESQ